MREEDTEEVKLFKLRKGARLSRTQKERKTKHRVIGQYVFARIGERTARLPEPNDFSKGKGLRQADGFLVRKTKRYLVADLK